MRKDALHPIGALDPAYLSAATLRGTWYEIDLGAIRRNYRALRNHLATRVRIYACLKRNGYGCGVGPVARTLALEGVSGFAVASVLDAVEIRASGVREAILLYPGATPLSVALLEDLDLTVTISSLDEVAQWQSVARRLPVCIKIDLGFFRAGATPGTAIDLISAVRGSQTLCLQGIYAHVSELPGQTRSHALAQLSRMNALLKELGRSGLPAPMTMMSSTESVLTYPEMDFDAVDPGALFFGLPEAVYPVRTVDLEPALKKISTSLVSVKAIDSSLGPLPELPGFRDGMRIGVIGMGWGDGVPRNLQTPSFALVRGRRAQLLPPAHLEHLRIDLTQIPDACFGDEVVLLGCQKGERISLEELAKDWGTDAVGLYANLRDHVPRIYT
ncbi:alanine racemase [Rhizobium sp. PP-F2F-G48]|uniref:alanine racemase n=1 Tax=Rhizobium sp. PP-F2F-G48 TaxID=2135651 RepID=UPI0010E4B0C3|nr:alanine racemase [Rhizobium sp. PP-F2F-G48]TCM50672.1 alanine racemase [Rhizobium sp. PP-F2F-G48]